MSAPLPWPAGGVATGADPARRSAAAEAGRAIAATAVVAAILVAARADAATAPRLLAADLVLALVGLVVAGRAAAGALPMGGALLAGATGAAATAAAGADARLLVLPVLLLPVLVALLDGPRPGTAIGALLGVGALVPVLAGGAPPITTGLVAAGAVALPPLAALALRRREDPGPPVPAGAPSPAVVPAPREEPPAWVAALSPRQRQVLALLGTGLRQAEIAQRLGLSVHQVAYDVRRSRELSGLPTTRAVLATLAAARR